MKQPCECSTRCVDKEDKERRQTIMCQKFHPHTGYLFEIFLTHKTGYLFHLMYAYITQGRPGMGLLRLIPQAQAIITKGIGVYATPLLQPTEKQNQNR